MVLDRHHSSRICLMLLALDTPKLWERFSLGFESPTLALKLEGKQEGSSPITSPEIMKLRLHRSSGSENKTKVLPVGVGFQFLEHGLACLSPHGAGQSLGPHQLPAPLHLPGQHRRRRARLWGHVVIAVEPAGTERETGDTSHQRNHFTESRRQCYKQARSLATQNAQSEF